MSCAPVSGYVYTTICQVKWHMSDILLQSAIYNYNMTDIIMIIYLQKQVMYNKSQYIGDILCVQTPPVAMVMLNVVHHHQGFC